MGGGGAQAAGGAAGGGLSSAEEAAELMGEVESLEESIDALKRMQAERHVTDARWLEEMMISVQHRILDRGNLQPSGLSAGGGAPPGTPGHASHAFMHHPASAAGGGSVGAGAGGWERPVSSHSLPPHLSTSAVPPSSLSSPHLASLHQRLLGGEDLGDLLGSGGLSAGLSGRLGDRLSGGGLAGVGLGGGSLAAGGGLGASLGAGLGGGLDGAVGGGLERTSLLSSLQNTFVNSPLAGLGGLRGAGLGGAGYGAGPAPHHQAGLGGGIHSKGLPYERLEGGRYQ